MATNTRPKKLGYRTTSRSRGLMMLAVDAVGYLGLWPWVWWRRWRGRRMAVTAASRIAVFRLDGIGDLVLSGPALRALRAAYPQAHITLFVNQWSDGLAQLLEGPDEVICLDATAFKMFKGKARWRNLLVEHRRLRQFGREHPFDLAIDLRGDFLSILEACWLGARQLVSRASRAGGFLLTRVISQPREGMINEVELNLEFVSRLTGRQHPLTPPQLKVDPDPLSRRVVAEFLEPIGSEYLCFAVAAPYASRCYPAEKWVEVMQQLRKTCSLPMIVLGAPGDRDLCERITAGAGAGVYSAAGRFSLMETAACIAGCRVFIGNDGGLIHIASALGRPLVQLFGPADPVCFGHYGEREILLHQPCPYRPCPESRCLIPDRWCMARIAPGDVVAAAARLAATVCRNPEGPNRSDSMDATTIESAAAASETTSSERDHR